jgi:hypothetical protein
LGFAKPPLKLPAQKTATEPTPRYMPASLKKDTRDDPRGLYLKSLMETEKPTKEQMMAAWNEMLPMINLVPWWADDWSPIFKRHGAMLDAIYAGKVKDVKGLAVQIIAAYKKVMKTGTWKGDAYGKEEPK